MPSMEVLLMFKSQIGRGRGLAVLGGVLAAVCLACTDARAEGGRLIVKSEPAGASVYLDAEDESRGVTPLALTDVATGLHKVRVTLTGYSGQRRGFYLTAGGERGFDFTLEANEEATPKPAIPEGIPEVEPAPEPKETKPTVVKKEKVSKTIDVDCPYCKGSKILKEMGCPSCKGTGYTSGGWRECNNCEGSRRVDFDCPYCKGKGVRVVSGRERDCKRCKGEGNLPCPPCKGLGTVKRANPEYARYPTTDCPQCDATGYVSDAKCSPCSGSGKRPRAGGGKKGGKKGGKRTCAFCKGEGKAPPVCTRCKGRAYQGSVNAAQPCVGCYGTGLAFSKCPPCQGRAFVRSRD
jgi:DnaJ-class molecular chaperone